MFPFTFGKEYAKYSKGLEWINKRFFCKANAFYDHKTKTMHLKNHFIVSNKIYGQAVHEGTHYLDMINKKWYDQMIKIGRSTKHNYENWTNRHFEFNAYTNQQDFIDIIGGEKRTLEEIIEQVR